MLFKILWSLKFYGVQNFMKFKIFLPAIVMCKRFIPSQKDRSQSYCTTLLGFGPRIKLCTPIWHFIASLMNTNVKDDRNDIWRKNILKIFYFWKHNNQTPIPRSNSETCDFWVTGLKTDNIENNKNVRLLTNKSFSIWSTTHNSCDTW